MQEVTNFFEERKKLGIQLGLERIQKLLNALHNPEQQIKAIHVAGTNGKGSTINFISSALAANGYRVGVFTSPSFEGLTGHIRMNGERMTDQEFLRIFKDIYPVIQLLDQSGIYATEFEILTAMAFVYFASFTDIALIETGMGGRYDTTNCFQPMLSIITNIDNDHANFLGNTITEIATHKVGIIKDQTPVIIGQLNKEVLPIIYHEVKNRNAPLYSLNKDFSFKVLENKGSIQSFAWEYMDKTFKLNLSMLGEHQIQNCSLAIMALFLINEHGIQINWNQSIKGISYAKLPGRFEVIPMNKNTIILDGAHNLSGIKSFINTVETNYRNVERKHLVFAAFKDKEFKKMLDELRPYFSTITLSTFNHPRAIPAQVLRKIENRMDRISVIQDIQTFVHQLKHMNCSDSRFYFFTGSLHFISYVRKLLLD